MQQHTSPVSNMEAADDGDQGTAPLSRGRPTSKLKVLGRSHAMREEQSPPREPCSAVPQGAHLSSPPTVVLSPSPVDDEEEEEEEALDSPATLVPSPNSRCSPQCEGNGPCERLQPAEGECNGKIGMVAEKLLGDKSSQTVTRSKKYCDCHNQNCIKCLKDRGGNNNNHTSLNNNMMSSPNMLFVNKQKGKLKQQSSSQSSLSFESSTGNSPCLSRDNSSDCYTDTTGVDLEQFIPETLNRNPKDRALMLRIEEELVSLAKDEYQTHYKFPPMSSYHRMLVHRCAAYFGMDHNIEQSGKCVVVNKTKNTRIPDIKFKEHIKEMFNDEPPRRSILKRDSNSIEDYCFKSPERGYGMEGRRSKSFEEREEEYERARRRIFRGDIHDGSSEDFGWSDMQWSSTESDYSRYRLQPPMLQRGQLRRLLKVHSEETEQSMRPCVAKSYSFGGYGGNVSILSRGDSVMSTHSAPGPRLLSKQDSGASSVSWRLSPSSSGYKSQSQMSESVTPSPSSTPHPPADAYEDHTHQSAKGGNPVLWAVSDLSNVPKGSVIINPETGKPLKNEDGSIYYYDPSRPPPGFLPPPESPPHPPEKLDRPPTPQKENTPIASPKREKKNSPAKMSPLKSKSSFTNTATSPSLPFSPPLSSSSSLGAPPTRTYSYLQMTNPCENATNMPHHQQPQQQFQAYPSLGEGGIPAPLYTQPYLVYTAPSYGMPVQHQYETRMDQPPDLSTTYFVPESSASAPYQPQPGPFYPHHQQVSFYANIQPPPPPPTTQTPPQRFFMPTNYPTPDVLPVYSNQVVYPPTGSVYAPTQPSLIYAHNPQVYQGAQYAPAYPQNAPTPTATDGFVQLAQGLHQMTLGPPTAGTPRGFVKCPPHPKMAMAPPPKPRPFFVGSSQSSTGTNSPAATVVAAGGAAGCCPQGQYHTPPPSTPPTPQLVFHQAGFPVGPRLYRQMSGERGPTPGTAKSSRSPTPAGDVTQFERQRFIFPPNVYQGMTMPYIVQSDPRLVGRGQPNVYRQTPPIFPTRQLTTPNADTRSHNNNSSSNKNRKSKGNKVGGLPPSGK